MTSQRRARRQRHVVRYGCRGGLDQSNPLRRIAAGQDDQQGSPLLGRRAAACPPEGQLRGGRAAQVGVGAAVLCRPCRRRGWSPQKTINGDSSRQGRTGGGHRATGKSPSAYVRLPRCDRAGDAQRRRGVRRMATWNVRPPVASAWNRRTRGLLRLRDVRHMDSVVDAQDRPGGEARRELQDAWSTAYRGDRSGRPLLARR